MLKDLLSSFIRFGIVLLHARIDVSGYGVFGSFLHVRHTEVFGRKVISIKLQLVSHAEQPMLEFWILAVVEKLGICDFYRLS
jgi:selenophosphate synthase